MICKKIFSWTLALKGILLAVLSGAFHSICATMVKQLKNIHPGQLSMYRYLFILTFSLPDLVRSGQNPLGPRGFRTILVLRGAFAATGMFLEYLAFRYLPLGEATVITVCAPVFVTVFARIFLKESCGVVQSLSVLATVLGILLVARIPLKLSGGEVTYTTEHLIGLLAALGSTLFFTVSILLLRKLSGVHASVTMFYGGWVSALVTSLLTAATGDFRLHFCGLQTLLVILVSVSGYGVTLLLTLALQSEQAGPVATSRLASEMVLAFLWQVLYFREASDGFGVSGAVLVSVSVLVIGFRKWVLSKPAESLLFRRFGWLKI